MRVRVLRSFRPIADRRSRVLILGTMPGPTALRRRQYYGFDGNHFWGIVAEVLGREKPTSYRDKVRMLREGGIALWDTLASCVRATALDSHIRHPKPNDVPGLLKRFPGIRAVFVNGRAAESYARRFFGAVAVKRLPSTSPANASISYAKKRALWRAALTTAFLSE